MIVTLVITCYLSTRINVLMLIILLFSSNSECKINIRKNKQSTPKQHEENINKLRLVNLAIERLDN